MATRRHRSNDREPNRIHRAHTIELICRVTKKAPAQSKRDPSRGAATSAGNSTGDEAVQAA
jgi:hypothetical protein